MKILYLLKSFAAKGGEERVMADKMNYLAEHGYEIILVTSEQGMHELAYPLNTMIKHVDLNTRFFTVTNEPILKKICILYKLRRQFVEKMIKIVKETRIDII